MKKDWEKRNEREKSRERKKNGISMIYPDSIRETTTVFDVHPTQWACVAQGLFFWWVRAQGWSSHAPGISQKIPTVLSAFLLLGSPQVLGNNPRRRR